MVTPIILSLTDISHPSPSPKSSGLPKFSLGLVPSNVTQYMQPAQDAIRDAPVITQARRHAASASRNFPEKTIVASILFKPRAREATDSRDANLPSTTPIDDVYLIGLHRDQMLAAAKAFSWDPSIVAQYSGDQGLLCFAHQLAGLRYSASLTRPGYVRHDFNAEISFNACLSSHGRWYLGVLLRRRQSPGILYPDQSFLDNNVNQPHERRSNVIDVYVDIAGCRISHFTRFNTTQRADQVQQRYLHTVPQISQTESEVLLLNNYDEIMGGASFTPYFFHGSRWITPTWSCGGVKQATKRWALEKGLCKEAVIMRNDLKEGESCCLSHDGKGFFYGIIRLKKVKPEPAPEHDAIDLTSEVRVRQPERDVQQPTAVDNEASAPIHPHSRRQRGAEDGEIPISGHYFSRSTEDIEA